MFSAGGNPPADGLHQEGATVSDCLVISGSLCSLILTLVFGFTLGVTSGPAGLGLVYKLIWSCVRHTKWL